MCGRAFGLFPHGNRTHSNHASKNGLFIYYIKPVKFNEFFEELSNFIENNNNVVKNPDE